MENVRGVRVSSARHMRSLPMMPVAIAELTRGWEPRRLAQGEAGELFIASAVMTPRAINKSVPLQSRIQKPFHEIN